MSERIALALLEPHTLGDAAVDGWREDTSWPEAVGMRFICPKCWLANGRSDIGVHSIICWQPSVPQTVPPTPGRWAMVGTSFDDVSLVAGSSSILLTGGCNAHFFIRNGHVEDLT